MVPKNVNDLSENLLQGSISRNAEQLKAEPGFLDQVITDISLSLSRSLSRSLSLSLSTEDTASKVRAPK
jgi:hypothetical protein